jgi:ATP-dependent Clp protease adaptor protein ClpS
MSTKKSKRKSQCKEVTSKNNEIIVYNDDVNTFDHVIDTLMRVCEHTPEQTEQCSLIVHYNGRVYGKNGSPDKLKPQCTGLRWIKCRNNINCFQQNNPYSFFLL